MRLLAFSFAALALTPLALGQWTVVKLHPLGALDSYGWAARGNLQGGDCRLDQYARPHAMMWSGGSSSAINLHPPGFERSQVLALGDGYQAGSADYKAATWHGTPQSYVNLNPPTAETSGINACWGQVKAGFAHFPFSADRAGFWTGAANSWVSLHMLGSSSVVLAYDGSQFAGSYVVGSGGTGTRAALWGNTPESMVELHPAGHSRSEALAVSGGLQGGYTVAPGGDEKAALWAGSASSFVNLNPTNATYSKIYAMHDGLQAGVADVNSRRCAGVWYGTAASFVNLAESLPYGYGQSEARGIWKEGGVTYVAGWARNDVLGRIESVLWRNPAVPSSLFGIIALTDIHWSPVYPRTITVKVMQGAQTIAQKNVTVATTAGLSMNIPGGGPAEVTIDGPTQLKRRRFIYLDGNPIDLGSVVLLNGDVDGSGEVDAADIDAAILDFGASVVNADVDLSGEVDAADIDIVISNFGLTDE